jgi:hypothetical protein
MAMHYLPGAQLPRIADALERGSVVVIEEDRLRIRALPVVRDTDR